MVVFVDLLPVYQDTYKLLLQLFKYTKKFPKEYKYNLTDKMRHDALQ
ncbi:TPA: four helix bundle protein [Legionella bozemanae]|nr:four helix bundle protein [Legionella bozemanae]